MKDTYEGEFKDNCITGVGFYTWKNKDTYKGTKNRRFELYKKFALESAYKKNNVFGFLGMYKSGSKITKKTKDDLLYKTGKDVVDHFRKMSKISSDAHNRKTPKIEKLTSHPKGKRKY